MSDISKKLFWYEFFCKNYRVHTVPPMFSAFICRLKIPYFYLYIVVMDGERGSGLYGIPTRITCTVHLYKSIENELLVQNTSMSVVMGNFFLKKKGTFEFRLVSSYDKFS